MEDKEQSWFDAHPVISDCIILFLPGITVFGIWMLFGVPLANALTQGVLITIVFLVGLAYLERSYENSVFRSFTLSSAGEKNR